MNWQVQKWPFLLGFLCRKRVLACSRNGLFNFRLLFVPANSLEIVQQIRDFRGDCLNFSLFIKKRSRPLFSGKLFAWTLLRLPELPIQKRYIWTSFQTSRKRFRKLQKAIWITVMNEIFKFPPHLDPFGQENYLYEFSSGHRNYPFQKWYIRTSS